jgi:8-oxo-dGTP pyrophosphatase MutT (NUDIX family)
MVIGRCQRSDDVVEPRLKTQWFIRVAPLSAKALASVRDAAIRETIEEGGISDVTLSELPAHIDRHPVRCADGRSEHLDVQFIATVPDGSKAVISEESDDLRWFALDALPADLDAAVLSMIAAAVATPAAER